MARRFPADMPFAACLADIVGAVLPLSPSVRCKEALHRFKSESGRTALPVVAEGVPVGVLTRTRLVEVLSRHASNPKILDVPVSRVMKAEPLVLEASSTLERAVEKLAERGDARLGEGVVVVDAGRYRGLVASTALMTALRQATERRPEAEEAPARVSGDQLAVMAHEVRTPLSGMIGVIDMLYDLKLEDEARELAATLKDSAGELNRFLDDLIEMGRITGGHMSLSPIDLDLDAFTKGLAAFWMPQAAAKKLSLKVDRRPGGSQFVRVDTGRLRQIVNNLISNAIKFTDRGGVTVTISTLRLAKGVRLSVEVVDTGCGVPEEARGRLFRPFSQIARADGSVRSGSGLGLSIVKALAEHMGGHVRHAPNGERGSRFTVEVEVGQALTRSHAEERTQRRGGFELGRVLVAEDHPVNRMVLVRALQGAGWQVDVVETGPQALRRALGTDYQAVLLDLRLPGMAGDEVVRRMREEGCGVVAFAVTADGSAEARAACEAAGFDAILEKPVQAGQLVARLSDAIIARAAGAGGSALRAVG